MARAYLPGDPRAAEAGRQGGIAGARTKRQRAMDRAVRAAGDDVSLLSARDYAIYQRGYTNGYSAGQKTGEARGRRKADTAA